MFGRCTHAMRPHEALKTYGADIIDILFRELDFNVSQNLSEASASQTLSSLLLQRQDLWRFV